MSFEQDFIHGYEKYCRVFDKWCEKASLLLGNITQCGIGEFDSSGHVLVALNRPDWGECFIDNKGYLVDEKYMYSENTFEGFATLNSNNGIQFLINNEEILFGKTFEIKHGFTFSERIDDNIYRNYFFGSDTPMIYHKLLNNMPLVINFIKYFKQENEYIVNYFRDRKFNIAERKKDYFICEPKDAYHSARRRMINTLHILNILDRDMTITNIEWECLCLHTLGKSVSQIGDTLAVSRNTVIIYLEVLKTKLKISPKSLELTYIIHNSSSSIFTMH